MLWAAFGLPLATTDAGKVSIETIELVRHAQASGCHYATIMNPATCPRTDDALLDYFHAVCSATDMSIIVFNTPAPGYMLHPQLLAQICDLPNVKGIKAAGDDADRIAVRAACGAKVVVSDPMEAHWFENLTVHRQSLLFADPEPYLYQWDGHRPIADYFAQFQGGDLQGLRRAFDGLSPLRKVYDRWVMGPLRAGRPPSAALKVWVEAMGLAAGPTRAPVRGLAADEKAALLRDLESVGVPGRNAVHS